MIPNLAQHFGNLTVDKVSPSADQIKSSPVELFFISNTGPAFEGMDENNNPKFKPAAGGLGRAIDDALRETGGAWTSVVVENPKQPASVVSVNKIVNYVPFAKEIQQKHYIYCNECAWPANHQEPERVVFDASNHVAHEKVIEVLGAHAFANTKPHTLINLDDYQVTGVAAEIRKHEANAFADGKTSSLERRRISYFHHTPFVSPATLDAIPQDAAKTLRAEAKSLLDSCDQLGFHTEEAAHNFLKAALGNDHEPEPIPEYDDIRFIRKDGSQVIIAVTPISIPTAHVKNTVESGELSESLRQRLNREITSPIVFYTGGERRDYSKRRLETVEEYTELLDENPQLAGKVQMLMVSIPTRMEVEEYKTYSDNLLAAIDKLRQKHAKDGWDPLILIDKALPNEDCILLSSMKGIDANPIVIGLLPPHQDGFNLTAAEMLVGINKGTVALSESIGAGKFFQGMVKTFDTYAPDAIKNVMKHCVEQAQTKEGLALWKIQRDTAVAKLESCDLAHWTAQRVYRLMSDEELSAVPHLNPDTYRKPDNSAREYDIFAPKEF